MWTAGDFLVPHVNGEPYSDKPPLLFWLLHLGWAVFGVNEWWPRLVAPLFAVANLVLTGRLARRLWPNEAAAAALAPWWLFGSALWLLLLTTTLFDMVLTFCALLGIHGVVRAAQGRAVPGWTLLGAGIGLGLLTKGPVILLHTLPVAVLGLSLVSGKQPHYLLPLLPAGALLAARLLSARALGVARRDALAPSVAITALGVLALAAASRPQVFGLPEAAASPSPAAGLALLVRAPPRADAQLRAVTVAMVALFAVAHWTIVRPMVAARYDLRDLAQYLARLQAEGARRSRRSGSTTGSSSSSAGCGSRFQCSRANRSPPGWMRTPRAAPSCCTSVPAVRLRERTIPRVPRRPRSGASSAASATAAGSSA